jgi:molybdenum cofactor synthesis domain-containing protein
MNELRIGILTCSDAKAAGAEDAGGTQLMEACEDLGWQVIDYHVCPDDAEAIACSMIELCDAEQADVIFTLGGTGLGPHEITPEATERISERMVPGIAEAIRDCCHDSREEYVLSRAVAGIRGHTLIINLPGGAGHTMEAFQVVAEYLPAAKGKMGGSGPSEASE